LEDLPGQLISSIETQQRHPEWLVFLKNQPGNTPGPARHLVVDNYATHKHPLVKA
jgi:hypothetical protein